MFSLFTTVSWQEFSMKIKVALFWDRPPSGAYGKLCFVFGATRSMESGDVIPSGPKECMSS
jgi:hypothetical protein